MDWNLRTAGGRGTRLAAISLIAALGGALLAPAGPLAGQVVIQGPTTVAPSSRPAPVVPAASAVAAAELTVESIMAEDWIGTFPESPYWGDDGRAVYYTKRRPKSAVKELRRIDLASGRDEAVPARELGAADHPGVWSTDRKVKAWERDGDIWMREAGRKPRQLTRTSDEETAPLPLTDGRIAFRRSDRAQVVAGESTVLFGRGDLFLAIDPRDGRIDTLADLRFGDDPEAPKEPEGFLPEHERRLFEVLSSRAAKNRELREHEDRRRAEDPTRPRRPFYLDKERVLLNASLSPSGRHLLVVIGTKPELPPADDEDNGGGTPDAMPRFVTDSGYVEVKKVRPKVGTGKPETPGLFLLDLVSGERRELDLAALPGLSDDPLAALRAEAEAASAAKKATAATASALPPAVPAGAKPAARALRFDSAAWSDDGGALAVQLISHDNKDRWIATVALATGAVQPLHRERDPAWLGWRFTDFGWMRDGRAVWFLSEESGFGHLHVQTVGGARLTLTQGPFEVDEPALSRDGKSFLVSANREQAGTYEVYRVPARGGALERLTTAGGMTHAIASPDEKQLLLTSSWATRPPELFLQKAVPASAGGAQRLTKSTTAEFDAVTWVAPEIVEIPSTHFAGRVQSRLYDLPSARPANGAPAVLFTHGAGYLQNAHAGWAHYFREFMFHTLLARRGYVVLDMDYRASSGYGRDHRTAIYRQMGWPEVEDLEDGVAWLVANRGVDRARVGTYGGSYGGFLTFMSMFRRPELFAAGAALRPVADWAHYNHGYTSSILNTPEIDPEAYRKSSPIEFASGLARPLLICHGMVDDNVTFQDTARLVQRLIELGKSDLFETAIYPVEPHAFKEASSWTDEYERILALFESRLK